MKIKFQEHQVLKEERFLTERLSSLEKGERMRFAELSNAVRDSHEKERAQAEKTKYWSVVFHVYSRLSRCCTARGSYV